MLTWHERVNELKQDVDDVYDDVLEICGQGKNSQELITDERDNSATDEGEDGA